MSAPRPERARRRRALLLGGLALVLGGLAATDMAGRERALAERIGEPVPVLVSRGAIAAGDPLRPENLARRMVPARYAPQGALASPGDVAGLRAATAIPPDTEILTAMLDDGRTPAIGAPVRRGERVAEVVASGSAELVQPGTRVDVLVTRDDRAGASGGTTLALQDVEVLAANPAGGAGPEGTEAIARVEASLRVSLRQAVYLAAAQSFAREVRLLPRAAGDRRRAHDMPEIGADLRGG
ncbi:MAG: Flp pilus assembly protein CpaB [Solirubrobacteraceae bacterium]|nr:Flp pilus assembly protein CpaB [Solirubrobacteraceae bacterium]